MSANVYALGKRESVAKESNKGLRNTARAAGVLYLVIIVAGIFAQFIVRQSLVVPGDAAATATNIMASEALFRAGIGADLVMVMADVAIGVLFYVLLRHANHTLALLAAFFRLGQAAVLGANLLNLVIVLQLLGGAPYLSAFEPAQLQALTLPFLNAHSIGYAMGLVFFGLSIFILGILLYKSERFPGVLGVALVIASLAYLVDGFGRVSLVNYAAIQPLMDSVVLTVAFLAEAALAVYLLVKGLRTTGADNATAQSRA